MDRKENTAAFTRVMEQHKGLLFKIAHSYAKVPDDRKDLIQEITIQLWKNFDKYNQAYRYSTWIYKIALNTSISFYRKENRRTGILNPISESLFDFSEEQVDSEKDQQVSMLYRFISELKDLDKALILLYLEEKSQKEMAEILGISETNVSTKISRIKEKLKQKFSTLNN